LSFRTGKAAGGCPARNAAESFFFATFFFAEKKKVGALCGKKESRSPFRKKESWSQNAEQKESRIPARINTPRTTI